MANERRGHDDEAWTNAQKVCRLTARQVEMARALGRNPKRLPRLRPSPQQRWKLPVGEFIEPRYWKRFSGHPHDQDSRGPEPRSRKRSTGVVATDVDANVSERVRDPAWQLSDLARYLMKLADDLQQWLAHGLIDPEVVPQVREELREIATALDTGAAISPIPAIPRPPMPTHRDLSRRGDRERAFDDEEIPFWRGSPSTGGCGRYSSTRARTGAASAPQVMPEGPWQYLHDHPNAARLFAGAMGAKSPAQIPAIPRSYDFSRVNRMGDIGGGNVRPRRTPSGHKR